MGLSKLNDHPDLAGMSAFHYQQATEADAAYVRIGMRDGGKNMQILRALIQRRDMHLKWYAMLNNAIRTASGNAD